MQGDAGNQQGSAPLVFRQTIHMAKTTRHQVIRDKDKRTAKAEGQRNQRTIARAVNGRNGRGKQGKIRRGQHDASAKGHQDIHPFCAQTTHCEHHGRAKGGQQIHHHRRAKGGKQIHMGHGECVTSFLQGWFHDMRHTASGETGVVFPD